MAVNVTAAWHKDLVHINKVRDNHVRYFGVRTRLTLYVPRNAEIGEHVSGNLAKIKRAPAWLSRRPLLYLYWWFDVLRHKSNRPDIVLGLHGSEPAAWFLAFLVRAFLVQDVWDQPGTTVDRTLKATALRLYGRMIWSSLRSANVVLASGELGTLFQQKHIGFEAIVKVPNGVSPLMSNETKDRKRVSVNTQRRLFYSGAFGNGRGAENLLEALVLLGKESYSIHFQCVGPLMQADYVQKYESTASRYASVIVEFTGNVESTEALILLCQADVCVCLCDDISQYRWTYPVKMGEYFQAKKHVVATGLPGMRSQAKWAEREDHVVFIENDNAPEAIAAGIRIAFEKQAMNLPCDDLPDHCTWPVIMDSVIDQVLKRYQDWKTKGNA